MTTKYRDRQDVHAGFSQTGIMGHSTPQGDMLADIILRLQHIEALLTTQKETAHHYGQDTEYKWYQSCKCPRCSGTTNRYAEEQQRAMSAPPASMPGEMRHG